MSLPRLFVPALLASSIFFTAVPGHSQVPDPITTAQAPIPGVGHHYIGIGAETVNPADGSISFELPIQTPPGRQLSFPFGIRFSSAEILSINNYLGQLQWATPPAPPFQLNGWSYNLPTITGATVVTSTSPDSSGGTDYCLGAANLVFSGFQGPEEFGTPPVAAINQWPRSTPPANHPLTCIYPGPAAQPSIMTSFNGAMVTLPPPLNTQPQQPMSVVDRTGTVYQFPSFSADTDPTGPPRPWGLLAQSITDRNGNHITLNGGNDNLGQGFASGNYVDTLGRTIVSWTGLGSTSGDQLTVSGLGGNIVVHWVTKTLTPPTGPSQFISGIQNPSGTPNCRFTGPQQTVQVQVVSEIDLPNGQKYTFQYGGTYNELNRITFPGGGYVRYVWGPNNLSTATLQHYSFTANGTQYQDSCYASITMPAITDRYVSYDGSTEVLHQQFVYSTPPFGSSPYWTSKTTTVTSTDILTSQVTQTIYAYGSVAEGGGTPSGQDYQYFWLTNQIPVEHQILYQDGSGHTLKTVNKTWLDQYAMIGSQTILDNGQGATVLRCYDSVTNNRVLSEYEYGFQSEGAYPGDPSCASLPSGTTLSSGLNTSALGPLKRQTTTAYQGFASAHIVNRPCQVDTYSVGSSPIAEIQYFYDGGSSLCGTPGTLAGAPVANLPTGTHDEANYGSNSTISRGNLTKLVKLCKPNCLTSYPAVSYGYDETGQMLTATDSCGNATCSDMTGSNHTTTYSYSDNFASGTGTPPGQTNAYLKQVTYPNTGVAHTESFSWGYNDGLVRSHTDQNSQVTFYTYNTPPPGCTDGLNRLSTITFPDTGQTTYCYNDSSYNASTPSPSVTTSKKISSSTNLTTLTAFDGVGHTTRTALTSDPDCASGDRTDTTYDGFGRVHTVSNPYCTTSDTNPPYGITTYTYDALGRTTQVTHPDNSAVLSTYIGRATQVQDEGNGTQRVTRISQSDGLGRLVSVCEVASGPFVGAGGASSPSLIGSAGTPANCGLDIPGTGFLTTYQYDALDNLLQANQSGIAPRTFAYDSLSRLTSASNPESGTIKYTYDANGNTATKIAPAPNQTGSATLTTTYTYDSLNRLVTKTYSDGEVDRPTYYYDTPPSWAGARQNAVGRMAAWTTINCLTMLYDYDAIGRPVNRTEYQPSDCNASHPIQNTYDLMGNMTSQTDGQWHTASYTYNTAGRIFGITDSQNAWPTNLLSNAHYNALGQVTSDSTGYGEIEAYSYDNRGRQQSSTITFNGYPVYSFSISSFAPNGDVLAANDSSNGNWTYSYDQFNRLTGSNQNSGAAVYTYVYDRFGNRWQQNGPHAFTATFTGNNPSSPANNNRIDGYSYDAAGNLTADGTHTYTYDAENRLIKVDNGNTSTFVYDGEGHRFSKTNSSSINSGGNVPDPSGTTEFVYDPQGHLVHTEAPNAGTGWRGEVFAGNRHLASYANGNLIFAHSDWLDTERNRDLPDPNNPQYPSNQNITSLPFGDWLDNTLGIAGNDWTPLNFTGHYHDFETDLDYFGARYYSNSTGRFMTPDWSNDPDPVPYADLNDPQSLNLYAYVDNSPATSTDDDGHDPFPNNDYSNGPNPAGRCGFWCWLSGLFRGGNPSTDEPKLAGWWQPPDPFLKHRPDSNNPTAQKPTTSPGLAPNPTPPAAASAAAVSLAICQFAEPCGISVDTAIIGAALITAGVYATKLAHTHFSSEQSLIRSIAKEYGISAAALGNAVHAWKRQHGMGGADNMTADQIREVANEVKQRLWTGTE